MIYMSGPYGAIVVLETANLEELKKGRPAKTPDGNVIIAWTPDMPFLAGVLQELAKEGSLDVATVGRAIDEAAKRPENPTPPRGK